MSTSSGNVCETPLNVTSTSLIDPLRPETTHVDGYGTPFPESGIVIAPPEQSAPAILFGLPASALSVCLRGRVTRRGACVREALEICAGSMAPVARFPLTAVFPDGPAPEAPNALTARVSAAMNAPTNGRRL